MGTVRIRTADALRLGAVAYDPKVVTIWEGFRDWFAAHDLPFDYILYSNYDRQVDALVAGEIDVAWNSPLAWVRARRMAAAACPNAVTAAAIAMRDTDCDLTSVVVVRADSAIQSAADLSGRRVGAGAVDSPQATLIPLWHLGREGAVDVEVVHHNIGVGKHGDHIGGERDAARALVEGRVDAACMMDGNHLLFTHEGTLAAGATRILTQTPTYDHCNFTVLAGADGTVLAGADGTVLAGADGTVAGADGTVLAGADSPAAGLLGRFKELLLSMSYADPEVRALLDLEGLKQWREGRTTGYRPLEAAVDEQGFYDADGTPRPLP